MSFLRSFDCTKIGKLTGKESELFEQIKSDIWSGEVFPSVRKDEIHFYYKGGCLYKFNGSSFVRDKKFEKYSENIDGLAPYEKAKQQNYTRYKHTDNSPKERQLLDRLNSHTFNAGRKTKVVVLDIEVRLNGEIGGTKKCDMVLLNTETCEIAFVEGKVFSDKRVLVAIDYIPEVIGQVDLYTSSIAEQRQTIIEQYGEHIRIVNEIFGTAYNPEITLIDTVKLLVYETPTNEKLTKNGRYTINIINSKLGVNNTAWYLTGEEPSLNEIWDALCR